MIAGACDFWSWQALRSGCMALARIFRKRRLALLFAYAQAWVEGVEP